MHPFAIISKVFLVAALADAAAALLLVLRHLCSNCLEVCLALAQADKLVNVGEDEVLDLVHQIPVAIDRIVIVAVINLPVEETTIEEDDDVVALSLAATLVVLVQRLLCSQFILLAELV